MKCLRSRPASEVKEQSVEGNDNQEANTELIEGYLLRFYADKRHSFFWSLFLVVGTRGQDGKRTSPPGHCVLGTCTDTSYELDDRYSEHLTALERELGIKMAMVNPEDISIQGASFEEWAVRTCFETMARDQQPTEECNLPRRFLAYLIAVYSAKGKKRFMTKGKRLSPVDAAKFNSEPDMQASAHTLSST